MSNATMKINFLKIILEAEEREKSEMCGGERKGISVGSVIWRTETALIRKQFRQVWPRRDPLRPLSIYRGAELHMIDYFYPTQRTRNGNFF